MQIEQFYIVLIKVLITFENSSRCDVTVSTLNHLFQEVLNYTKLYGYVVLPC